MTEEKKVVHIEDLSAEEVGELLNLRKAIHEIQESAIRDPNVILMAGRALASVLFDTNAEIVKIDFDNFGKKGEEPIGNVKVWVFREEYDLSQELDSDGYDDDYAEEEDFDGDEFDDEEEEGCRDYSDEE